MNEQKELTQRTKRQNRALHKYFSLLADRLNDCGLDMKKVLKPTVDIPWTSDSVKTHLWKPIMEAMYEITSTTEMTTGQVTKVYETINRHMAEKFGLSEPFPSIEELMLMKVEDYKHVK